MRLKFYGFETDGNRRYLQPETSYLFRVKVKNYVNESYSPWSEITNFTTRPSSIGELTLENAAISISETETFIDVVVKRINGVHGTLYAKLKTKNTDNTA